MKKIFIVATLFFVPALAHAATLSVVPEYPLSAVGQEVRLLVVLDSSDTAVNALEGTVVLPKSISVEAVDDGNSVMSFWIEKPEAKGNTFTFSGITPGGFAGKGTVFSILAKVVDASGGSARFSSVHAYANDGKGSEITLVAPAVSLALGKGKAESSGIVTDTAPPESFVPTVGHDLAILNDARFVAFAASDKGSGIERYTVSESKDFAFSFFAERKTATSPYMLSDQKGESFIRVTAYDRAGHARTELVWPEHLQWFSQSIVWAAVLLIILIALVFVRKHR